MKASKKPAKKAVKATRRPQLETVSSPPKVEPAPAVPAETRGRCVNHAPPVSPPLPETPVPPVLFLHPDPAISGGTIPTDPAEAGGTIPACPAEAAAAEPIRMRR
jgi:hypothetical protein